MKALVPLANGFEEMEAVVTADILRRAGWTVTLAGMTHGLITAGHGLRVAPDVYWDDIEPGSFDVVILPGGGAGVQNLRQDKRLLEALRNFQREGKWMAAICAAPLVLQEAGVLGQLATCHPQVASQLAKKVNRVIAPVVVDGKIITSQAAGTAVAFALKLVELIDDPDKVAGLKEAMVL